MTENESCGGETAGFACELATAMLVLRAPRDADAAVIAKLADNPNLAQMTASLPRPYDLDEARAFIARARQTFGRAPTYILHAREGGVLVGACGFRPCEEEDGGEIGYWIGEPFWGRGYATQAAQAVTDLFFTGTDGRYLFGACRVINPASRRVLEKCGFQRCGEGMIHSRALGGLVPVHRYRLDRRVWRSLKGWAAAARA